MGFEKELKKRGIENNGQLSEAVNKGVETAMVRIKKNNEAILNLQRENEELLDKIVKSQTAINTLLAE